jgi:signal peptidase II
MVYIGIMIAIIILDQGTKYLALKYLSQKENRPVIKDFLYFTIVKNKGAALGILKSKPLLLKMITVSPIGALFWYLI